MNVFVYFLFDSLFELENSPHEFSSMGNFKTIKKKKRVFWLEFVFHERCFSWHRLCGPRGPYRDLPPPPLQGNNAG